MSTERDRPAAGDALGAMGEHASVVREEAVQTAIGRLEQQADLDERDRRTIEDLADRLVGGLLASPTAALVAGDEDCVETALALFADDAGPRASVEAREEPARAPSGD